MATIKELIAGIEVELEAAQKREQKARKEIEIILATAQQEGRSSLTEEEDERSEQLFEAIKLAKAAQEGITRKLARAQKVEAEETEAELRFKEVTEVKRAPKPKYDEVARVGSEERTYNREADPTGAMFLRDVAKQFLYNDVQASARLSRHIQEERVERAGAAYMERSSAGTGTSAFPGLVVPQYLIDMVAPAVANLRPFADAMNKHPLPADGMSLNIPLVSTASSVAIPSQEIPTAPGVSWTDMASTMLTVNVQTAAGQALLSRQAIDRGAGIEDIVLQDLFARYNTALDKQVITMATVGLDAVATAHDPGGAGAITTPAEIYPVIANAAGSVEAALLGYGKASHVVMHPKRWYNMVGYLGNTWPLIGVSGVPERQGGTADAGSSYPSGNRGILPIGLDVVVDNNVPVTANADTMYVVPQRECHLWEDAGAPAFIRAEQPAANQLGVMLVVYGYFAFTMQRYSGIIHSIKGAKQTLPT